jgi:septal ring factor EnvC (AmiA/AmiB activator)
MEAMRPLDLRPIVRTLAMAAACAMAAAGPWSVPFPFSFGPATAGEVGGAEAEKARHEEELKRLEEERRKAAEAEARLKAEIEALGEDRRKLSRALIEAAARIRGTEAQIAASEERLRTLDERERSIRTSLEQRRSVIAAVLAALQRIGRDPPPALLVQPEEALRSLRSAMMLGAVLPELRLEARALAADLGELARVRGAMRAEREAAARDLATLVEERRRMTLLIEERQRRQTEAARALEGERERIVALGRQAESLKELIARLEKETTRAAMTARGLGESDPRTAVLKDPNGWGRLGPAVAFAAAKGALPLPVNGVRIREFGAPDGLGGSEKGLTVATRPGAQVIAPCDGWIVYAGPFRSYGQLLILNAGGGYHVLLAGMERISVALGQFVLAGEPVAVMGGGRPASARVTGGTGQPALYIEFRKDGTPVDPSPWWARTESEKVRG